MSESEQPIHTLERQQRALYHAISTSQKAAEQYFAENPSESSVNKAAVILDTWKAELNDLREVVNEILDITDYTVCKDQNEISALEEQISNKYNSKKIAYAAARGRLNEIISHIRKEKEIIVTPRQSLNPSQLDAAPQNPMVKLPDIPVPKFDGDIKNFTEWKSLFEAMIHDNENLRPVQKLYFLRQAMVGDAKNLLKDVKLDGDIYAETWRFVQDRFFNRRAIIASHFRALLSLPTVTISTLRESIDKLKSLERGLAVCGIDVPKLSPLFTYIVVTKLPEKIRTDWETYYVDTSTYPSFEPLANFLQNRCFAYESMAAENKPSTSQKSSSNTSTTQEKTSKAGTKSSLAITSVDSRNKSFQIRCSLCDKDHYLRSCPVFLAKSMSERLAFVKEKGLCMNCLRKGHLVAHCNASRCRMCGKGHNSLLHREVSTENSPKVEKEVKGDNKTEVSSPKTSMSISTKSKAFILLPTAVVNVHLGAKIIAARVIIDACSQANLVSKPFVRKHQLSTRPSSSVIVTAHPSDYAANLSVTLKVSSRLNNYQLRFEADVVDRLPYRSPTELNEKLRSLLIDLPLADQDLQSDYTDLLIGGEFAHEILLGKKKNIGDIWFEESQFGWIVGGPLHSSIIPHSCLMTVKSDEILTKFWEVENVEPRSASSKFEHELCEAHFRETYTRLPDGRFQVRLPVKEKAPVLANTFLQALAALLRSEKSYDGEVRDMYVKFMIEYRDLDHMELCIGQLPRYFIPHLPVLRPDSSTTKLRVVFNASAKNSSGISLNAALMNGPVLQPDLFDTLIRFRTHIVAFAADISKMYRQIAVHPADQPLQAILWRDDPNSKIDTYFLKTLTYGTTPAAYIATKCLQVVADELRSTMPDVADAIAQDFYMDDLLSGGDSLETALCKRNLIHDALRNAKFPLRKYVSNSEEFLIQLEPSLIEELRPLQFSSGGAAKILGLQWMPATDIFLINVKIKDIEQVQLTKRIVASLIAQIYDPLGIVAPVTIRSKLMLQDLWKEGRSWDEVVSEKLAEQFRSYYLDLQSLNKFSLPRCYFSSPGVKFDLVGFCDASNRAYGAVIYLRVYEPLEIRTILVCSKTRVAPLKEMTIPRLELLGASLLAKLLSRVCSIMNFDVKKAVAYCDSTIVLAWLKGPSSKFQVFVHNRVEAITSILPYENWKYVGTAENPADLVTRGITTNALNGSTLWKNGPLWLSQNNFESSAPDYPSEIPEVCKAAHLTTQLEMFDDTLLRRYSSYTKLIRIVSRILKFANQSKTYTRRYPMVDLLTQAKYMICRLSQLCSFKSEILSLKKNGTIEKNSSLKALHPYLDSWGVLRVSGRLEHAPLAHDTKHPIIVHSKSPLAEMLIRHVHDNYFHATHSFVAGHIQAQFWIHGGLNRLIKKVLYQCVWCTRVKGQACQQLMGQLPPERTIAIRPFAHVGVDLAGPFAVRCVNHRTYKTMKYYASFFVCLATRAVHIETTSDLSTKIFIETLQRFIARRGKPNTIFSDNGTNFVGANNAIGSELQLSWKFIPPRSPHQGGIWESAVKAAKKYLFSATKGVVLDAEQLATLFTQIEAILNSRPLYQRRRTESPNTIDVITPGHFLIGDNLLSNAPPETYHESLFKKYEKLRQITTVFWRLWKQNYLAQLNSRVKWDVEHKNVAVGDVVLLREETPPIKWPMGVVMETFSDSSGQVRIVQIRTANVSLRRSVQKLIRLPVEPSDP